MSVSRLVSKLSTMVATQDKMATNKNGVEMILDARKVKNGEIVFYLEEKRYAPEGLKLQEAKK